MLNQVDTVADRSDTVARGFHVHAGARVACGRLFQFGNALAALLARFGIADGHAAFAAHTVDVGSAVFTAADGLASAQKNGGQGNQN